MAIRISSIEPNVLNALLDVLSYIIIALTSMVMARAVHLANQWRLDTGKGVPVNQLGRNLWSFSDLYTTIRLSEASWIVFLGFLIWSLIVVVHPVADLYLQFEAELVPTDKNISTVTYPFYASTKVQDYADRPSSDWIGLQIGIEGGGRFPDGSFYFPLILTANSSYINVPSPQLSERNSNDYSLTPLMRTSTFYLTQKGKTGDGEEAVIDIFEGNHPKDFDRIHYYPESQGNPQPLVELMGGISVNCSYEQGKIHPEAMEVAEIIVFRGKLSEETVINLQRSRRSNCTMRDWPIWDDHPECQGPVACVDDAVFTKKVVPGFDSWILNATGDVPLWAQNFTGNVAFSSARPTNENTPATHGPLLLRPTTIQPCCPDSEVLPPPQSFGEVQSSLMYELLTVMSEDTCLSRGHVPVVPSPLQADNRRLGCRRPLLYDERACLLITAVECNTQDGVAVCDRVGRVVSFLVTGYVPDIKDLQVLASVGLRRVMLKSLLDDDSLFIPSFVYNEARYILGAQAQRWDGEVVPQYGERVVAVIEWPFFLILTLCLTVAVIGWIAVLVVARDRSHLPVPVDVWEGIQMGFLEGSKAEALHGVEEDSDLPLRTSSVEPFHKDATKLLYGAKSWSKGKQQLGITMTPVEVSRLSFPDTTLPQPESPSEPSSEGGELTTLPQPETISESSSEGDELSC